MTVKRGIDHLVLCVNDLDLCAAFYWDLGFTTTPRAQHPWGTDNCLIQLNGSFIELLTVLRPSLITEDRPKAFSFGAFNQNSRNPNVLSSRARISSFKPRGALSGLSPQPRLRADMKLGRLTVFLKPLIF